VAPEFQITTRPAWWAGSTSSRRLARNGFYGNDETRLTLNLTELNALAARPRTSPTGSTCCCSRAHERRAALDADHHARRAAAAQDRGGSVTDRVKAALILVAMSPEYVIQK
jgi:hypothetical protein